MGRTSMLACVASIAALFILWQWAPADGKNAAEVSESAKTLQPDGQESAKSSGPPDGQAGVEEANRLGLSDEEVARVKRRYEFEQAAEQRFHQTADMDGLSPDSVSSEARELFRTLRLEPEFDLEEGQQGYVDGMRVARMASDNPLAQAGFQVGDRLTRINGEALRDPATIAHLVTRIGSAMEVCAMRAGTRLCRQVTLAPPGG